MWLLVILFLICRYNANAFLSFDQAIASSRASTTSQHAVAPPLIFAPILKKFREDQEKKKMPMADTTEAANQSPGLRVGKNAWRWPPVWPYDAQFFMPNKLSEDIERKRNMDQMASALSGIAMINQGKEMDMTPDEEEETFDAMAFWETEGAVETELDAEAAAKLRAHFRYYLDEDMSILELGAAEASYLPFKPARHVGVGASLDLMEKNPSLTDRMVVDLNEVEEGRDINNDDFRVLSKEPFDAVIITNTIAYLRNPREVLRSAWYQLKPGGMLIVAYGTKGVSKAEFPDVQTRMWARYNDDQHMWMTGSFFHFSAGEGWVDLMGFDISPDSAKDMSASGPMAMLKRGKTNNMFVVQATKGYQDDTVNPNDPEGSIRSLCWMLPTMEGRDKSLVVPRLARVYEITRDEEIRAAIENHLELLPTVYEAMVKMDAFAFTFSMQAQLATDLLCDPKFTASDVQMTALKEGLGLRTPSKEFWGPVGTDTAAIPVEDKISLLGYIVPRFDSGDPAQEAALQSFVTGLKPTYEVIRSKCPDMAEQDVQLMGAELLAYEILTPGQTDRDQFARWLDALTKDELEELLSNRKSYRRAAAEGLEDYKEELAAREARLAELRAKMADQKENARLTRSMVFNPRSQKFETFDNPNKDELKKKEKDKKKK